MQGHQQPTDEDETRVHAVEECPRCGQDHGEVTFRRMEGPVEGPGGEFPWWWWSCSTTGAPVLAQLAWEEC
jgi:hypothetical protein